MWKKNSRNKNNRADLNSWAIDPKFLHVVDNLKAYNLYKFQIDSMKIRAYPIQNVEKKSRNKNNRPDLNFWKF